MSPTQDLFRCLKHNKLPLPSVPVRRQWSSLAWDRVSAASAVASVSQRAPSHAPFGNTLSQKRGFFPLHKHGCALRDVPWARAPLCQGEVCIFLFNKILNNWSSACPACVFATPERNILMFPANKSQGKDSGKKSCKPRLRSGSGPMTYLWESRFTCGCRLETAAWGTMVQFFMLEG